jgi:hypothetical protein
MAMKRHSTAEHIIPLRIRLFPFIVVCGDFWVDFHTDAEETTAA